LITAIEQIEAFQNLHTAIIKSSTHTSFSLREAIKIHHKAQLDKENFSTQLSTNASELARYRQRGELRSTYDLYPDQQRVP